MNVAESAAIAFAFARAVGMPAMVPCTGKQPRVSKFGAYSTALQAPGQLRGWLAWSAKPRGPNAWAMYSGPGVAAGSLDKSGQRPAPRLVVLDIDTRDATIADRLLSIYGRSPLTVRTPGRGTHHYFREPEGDEVETTLFSARGYDVKARKSLCHLPGSLHPNGGRYVAFYRGQALGVSDLLSGPCGFLLGTLPTFNVRAFEDERARCGIVRTLRDDGNEVILDDDVARHRGEAWLAKRAPATSGQAGNPHTVTTACGLGDIGVPVDIALELMSGAWNDTCNPPWPLHELETIVRSAYRSRQTSIGSRARVIVLDDESGALEENAADERELASKADVRDMLAQACEQAKASQ